MINMKRILAGCAVVLMTASAFGADEKLFMHNTHAWGGNLSGGPFEAQAFNFPFPVGGLGQNGASKADRFITFCMEGNEFIGNKTMYDAVISKEAVNGGNGGGNPDPLDDRTAFLFTAFTRGQLTSKIADFTYLDPVDGRALQDAIWYIEEEIGEVNGLAADLVDLANDAVAFGGEWFGKGTGEVFVLNLYKASGKPIQDVLVMAIPLPIAAALGLVGLAGVGVLRRRQPVA
jgi:hypothetical protein